MLYADLRLQLRFRTGGRLPAFRGPTLRGALGYVLKRVVCHVRGRPCGECFLRARCAYPVVFEGVAPPGRAVMRKYPNIPQPFVLVLDAQNDRDVRPNDEYAFTIRLFGPAIELHPFVLMAMIECGRTGLGRDRLAFDVVAVDDGAKVLYRAGEEHEIHPPEARRVAPVAECGNGRGGLRLRFETPVRIRTDGLLNTQPTLAPVVRAAVRRIAVLSHFYGDGPVLPENSGALIEEAAAAICAVNSLRWVHFDRFSTRQQRTMTLGGVVGELQLENISPGLAALLRVATITHVGKATSFGFGRISCDPGEP